MTNFNFKVKEKDKHSKARVGEIHTPHGVIKTPSFIPVGTRATVRSLTPEDIKETGTQILFGNTYHLHLRPGEDTVKDFGGLGKFMNWDGPTITDSGGFQVFSLGKAGSTQIRKQIYTDISGNQQGVIARSRQLAETKQSQILNHIHYVQCKQVQDDKKEIAALPLVARNDKDSEPTLVKISKDGVQFRSHIDGSLHMFTPEVSIQIQQKLGADLILVFDECAPHPSTHEYTKEAMERTHEWAIRSLKAHKKKISGSEEREVGYGSGSVTCEMGNSKRPISHLPTHLSNPNLTSHFQQSIYGIVQGGVYEDLRNESAKFISKLDFDGIAIGGVSVGESKKQMRNVLDWTVPFLPEEKPRHALGIGEVDDIFDIIEKGIDTFDCVLPTRLGRYGIIYVSPKEGKMANKFRIDISKSVFAKDKGPMTNDCKCYVCRHFTRGYIHHLFKCEELLAYRLASYHNVYFINNLVTKIRDSILDGTFQSLKEKWMG